jgi:CO dehydrogenase nickel-insertion accessory protein CooC1
MPFTSLGQRKKFENSDCAQRGERFHYGETETRTRSQKMKTWSEYRASFLLMKLRILKLGGIHSGCKCEMKTLCQGRKSKREYLWKKITSFYTVPIQILGIQSMIRK